MPALRLKAASQRLGGGDVIEVDSPVREPGERLIREGDKRVDAHRRVLLDPHDVEVEVPWIARCAQDRAVRPRLDNVADSGMLGVQPGTRPGRRAGA